MDYFKQTDKQKQTERLTGYTKEEIIDFILSGQVIATVTSVAPSGMSRTIKFGVFRNGYISNITIYIQLLYSGYYTYGSNSGFRVSGCGMDMCFHTLYNALASVDYSLASKRNQKYITW